jgi:hypothetical protein
LGLKKGGGMHFDDNLKVTTNHNDIMAWARNRNGLPIRIRGNNNQPGLGSLKIFFTEYEDKDPDWEEITWEEFLFEFEKKKLAMEFTEHNKSGERSLYYKFFHRQNTPHPPHL